MYKINFMAMSTLPTNRQVPASVNEAPEDRQSFATKKIRAQFSTILYAFSITTGRGLTAFTVKASELYMISYPLTKIDGFKSQAKVPRSPM
ncbi:hypothetical protein OUZ56_010909 [Daphnia magna]|uniref:Uncharacterized protein n=1 Tax=Daphnia magna TaxID=35525 RepID=A0ABQ9YYR1_9CRUS|nr:hypothetical protein OUZ56_010909 [Daphnia magna]